MHTCCHAAILLSNANEIRKREIDLRECGERGVTLEPIRMFEHAEQRLLRGLLEDAGRLQADPTHARPARLRHRPLADPDVTHRGDRSGDRAL